MNWLQQYFWNRLYPDGEHETLWSGIQASEHQLKQHPQPPQILHLATHGFYLEDQTELNRPLVLSGLALANANQGIQGQLDSHGEDGILYALEILDLNLQGTQLVTLSACDTGKGVVDYTEGVYGLIRAFRVAGAQHVLLTLRSVKDADAFRFMKAFYRRWANDTGSLAHPAEALRATKLHFIQQGKPVEQWSPYVLIQGNRTAL